MTVSPEVTVCRSLDWVVTASIALTTSSAVAARTLTTPKRTTATTVKMLPESFMLYSEKRRGRKDVAARGSNGVE